ncbi:restriction endonuclease subunit S [Streptococcus suis]|uniref:restriction endonuclease subunit S n=1 Tax=Streptococcus suis TaxID=1307 RepID=UPI000CF586BC
MTKEKSTVPRLRFPGFTDTWKQRKLGEVLKERNESRSPSADVPLVSFTVENGVTPKTERYNREFLVRDEDKKYKFTQLDDIVYNPANLKFGAIARNKYGAAVFSPIYVTYGVLSEAHPLFVELIVTSTNFIQRALRYQEGTVYERMAVKSFDLLRSEIPLPTHPEQEAIGSFFSDLDQLITLHQRKLDDVKELKKALLQKMFPKGNGNDFPELRFPEFTDAWKQRKLGEVAISFDYGLNSAATEYDGENKYLRITDIDDDSREFNISDLTSPEINLFGLDEYRLSIGDILFARTGASVGKSYIYRSVDGKVYFAGFLIRVKIKDTFNPDFVFQNTLTSNYERFISITSMRSGQPGVNAQEYSNYKIMFPTLPEQEVIGSFFSDLDQLITLHQRQLDHLKLLKKALLQQMFI